MINVNLELFGGRGGGISGKNRGSLRESGGSRNGLSADSIRRANNAHVMPVGDYISNSYKSGVSEIRNLKGLTEKEKRSAINEYTAATEKALKASAADVNGFVSGRSRLTSQQKSGRASDNALKARSEMSAVIDKAKKQSNKATSAEKASSLTQATVNAFNSGALEFTFDGKVYRRKNARSKSWTRV